MKRGAVFVVIEPHAALYRYLRVAKQKFRTLVLTSSRHYCVLGENEYNHSLEDVEGSHIDTLIECDTTKSNVMLEALGTYRGEVAGVVAGNELFVPVAAELGCLLGFDCAPREDAICQHDKIAMKRRLRERNVPTGRFHVARDLDEASAAWDKLGRDCMLKMVNYASSANVFRVRTRQQLELAWDTVVHNTSHFHMPFPPAWEVILEEFIGGKELTVEGYVSGERVVPLNFSEKLTEANFIVVGHLIPAVISSGEEEQLTRIAKLCTRALGIRNSAFHAEVHLKEGLPHVIECAARPPGLHTVEMIHRSYGYDMTDISIELATGGSVSTSRTKAQRYTAILALYSMERGVLERIDGLDELESRGGLLRVKIDVAKGDRINRLTTYRDKYGFIALEDPTPDGVREKAQWAREHVRMVLS